MKKLWHRLISHREFPAAMDWFVVLVGRGVISGRSMLMFILGWIHKGG